MTFTELRAQYPEFIFDKITACYADGQLMISYRFEISGLSEFAPQWKIPCDAPDLADPALRRLIFALGMTELVSYWKITCSPRVILRDWSLTDAEKDWWKKLYFGGLGEFFYRNQAETTLAEFMEIVCEGAPLPDAPSEKALSGLLIPVGGGKDSIVTLNLLKDRLADACAYQINHRDSAEQSALLSGIPKARILEASRTLDPNMLECNRRGFLNGHTPLSAVVAFSAALTAYLHGKQRVVLSNESSANESSVHETEINHQYSKSFAFECDFRAYARDFLRCGIDYFSLLRPLTEFQIARYFASLPPAYHRAFRSCNAGNARGRKDSWCGHCAKCLFVSVILLPFLPYREIADFLQSDILNLPEMEQDLLGLCGALPDKPFECVGERIEVNTALCLGIARMERDGEPLPLLVQKYKSLPQYMQYRDGAADFGQEWDSQHNLTPELAALVRHECLERFV